MRLFGGKIGFVGSGIHSLSSQILSKSFRNWFENRTLRGTKMERSFTSLLFSFIYLSIYTHLSLHIYPLTSYHIPHSTETENTGSHQKVHWRQTRQHLASAISTSRMWLSTTRHTRRLMKRVSPSISNIALMIKDRLDILHICLKKRKGGKYLSMAFTSFSFIIIDRKNRLPFKLKDQICSL